MLKSILSAAGFLFAVVVASAQTKASIAEGPVDALSKYDVIPRKESTNGYPYTQETVYLQKGDWLVARNRCRERMTSIYVYDRQAKKYIRAAEDTTRRNPSYETTLTWVAERSDSFDIMLAGRFDKSIYDEGDSWVDPPKKDTPKLSYTIGILRAAKAEVDPAWDFRKRLSYVANHWTAGFTAMPRTANEEQEKSGKPIREYLPEAPVSVLNEMGVSIQVFGYGYQDKGNAHQAYFMFTADEPYAKAKATYDKLVAMLKPITDFVEVKNMNDPNSLRRVGELATARFALKVPNHKAPIDYWFLEDAGKGFKKLPISLFLFGDKQKAKVMIVLGEASDDIYDMGS